MVNKADNQATTKDSGTSKRRLAILMLLLLLLSMSCIFCSAQSAIMSINRESMKADLYPKNLPNYEDEGNLVFAPLNEDILDEVRADYDRLNLQPVIEIDAVENDVDIAALPKPEILAQPTAEPAIVVSFPTPTPTPITDTIKTDDSATAVADSPPTPVDEDTPPPISTRSPPTPVPTQPPATVAPTIEPSPTVGVNTPTA
ncbi:hypothetical protein QUF64_07805, partial [Anaerolineales bacterium HSG6]|nr:hypothetical protein [Anaerolineales bacterium HSG6]